MSKGEKNKPGPNISKHGPAKPTNVTMTGHTKDIFASADPTGRGNVSKGARHAAEFFAAFAGVHPFEWRFKIKIKSSEGTGNGVMPITTIDWASVDEETDTIKVLINGQYEDCFLSEIKPAFKKAV